VCNGDGTSCLDCSANCFNLARCYFGSLFTRSGAYKYNQFSIAGKSNCKNC